jgi:hypothetical protein
MTDDELDPESLETIETSSVISEKFKVLGVIHKSNFDVVVLHVQH